MGLVALSSASAVYAQSSITLYGILDAGLLYSSKTVNATTGQNTGKQFSMIGAGLTPSVFGLTGTEDLGGGLKLKFKLESGYSLADGGLADCNGNIFGCEAWLALDGKYGTVKAGLQYSPFLLAMYQTDPRNFSLFASGIVSMVDNVLGTGIYNSNAVSYTSPVIAGLQGSVMYALGGAAGNFSAGRQYSASLKYQLDGFLIAAAIYDGNSGGAAQTPTPTTLQYEGRMIGMSYRFGLVNAKLSFANYKVAGSFNNNVYGGGFDYLVVPTLSVDAGIYVTSDRNHTANHSVMGALGAQFSARPSQVRTSMSAGPPASWSGCCPALEHGVGPKISSTGNISPRRQRRKSNVMQPSTYKSAITGRSIRFQLV